MCFVSKCPGGLTVNFHFYCLLTTFVGVDRQGANCTKSKYSVLRVLPMPRIFGT